MNILTRESHPEILELVTENGDWYDQSKNDHRRGSNFFCQNIYKIDEKYFPEIDREFDGFWETNTFVFDAEFGFDRSEIRTLTRVEQKTKLVEVKTWEPV
jgi:hypothetical protein